MDADIPTVAHEPLKRDAAEIADTAVELSKDHSATVEEAAQTVVEANAGEHVMQCDTVSKVYCAFHSNFIHRRL